MAFIKWLIVLLTKNKAMVLRCKSHGEVRLLDLALLLRAATAHEAIDIIHRRILGVVLGIEHFLDPAVVCELFPVVDVLEHIVHCNGNLATRFAHYARMIILSPPDVKNGIEASFVFLHFSEPLALSLITGLALRYVLIREHDVEDGDEEENSAHKSFRLQIISLEERHHANLVAHCDEEGCVSRGLDQLTLGVNLLTIHIQ